MLGLVVPDTSLPLRSGAQTSWKNYQPQKVMRASLRLCRFELWDKELRKSSPDVKACLNRHIAGLVAL